MNPSPRHRVLLAEDEEFVDFVTGNVNRDRVALENGAIASLDKPVSTENVDGLIRRLGQLGRTSCRTHGYQG